MKANKQKIFLMLFVASIGWVELYVVRYTNLLFFIKSLPYSLQVIIFYIDFFIRISTFISSAGLVLSIPVMFVLAVNSHFREPQLKCPQCGKKDTLQLYSYSWTYEVKVSIGRYNPETKTGSIGRGRYLETDLRGWVDKCYFCGYEFACNHTSYYHSSSAHHYSQSDYDFSQLSTDEQVFQMWADDHYILGGIGQVRKKYLYNNEVHAIQVCRKCGKPNIWDNKCLNCGDSNSEVLGYVWQCSHCGKWSSNLTTRCSYCYTGRPSMF